MPFHLNTNRKKQKRKEQDSFIAQQNSPHTLLERVSGSASRGSITVEASLAVSLFFFAIITLMNLFEIMYVQIAVKNALCSVGKQMAVESTFSPAIFPSQIETRLAENIGEDMLETSVIRGGATGLDCSRSKCYLMSTIMELTVDYELEFPILGFRIPILERSESIRVKGWSGYEDSRLGLDNSQTVYVTEYGIVYHEDRACTYLELSIHPVLKQEAIGYKPCNFCGGSAGKLVYVTNYGEKYHSSLECRGLKRKIYAVSLDEVYGIGGCGKCVK